MSRHRTDVQEAVTTAPSPTDLKIFRQDHLPVQTGQPSLHVSRARSNHHSSVSLPMYQGHLSHRQVQSDSLLPQGKRLLHLQDRLVRHRTAGTSLQQEGFSIRTQPLHPVMSLKAIWQGLPEDRRHIRSTGIWDSAKVHRGRFIIPHHIGTATGREAFR